MSVINTGSKGSIRNECLAMRRAMTAGEKSRADKRIFESFISLDVYSQCKTLLTYVSTAVEVDTRAIIADALACGKRVAVPVCGKSGHMDFYYIEGFDSLKSVKFGIEEPIPSVASFVSDFTGSLCIVPGLCFDSEGFRIGFGGGYYDRFLAAKSIRSVGICYESCVLSGLPHESFDRRVELLLTDKKIRNIVG